jgi:CheY-like chemotaxis protein
MNILLIEDNPTDRKLLSVVLQTSGHSVAEYVTAEEALAAIKRQPPEVILLDLKLPGMSGLALARQLKQDDETRGIPIVALTAAAESFSRSDALSSGCDAYIVKPIDTRKLPGQVTQAAGNARSDESPGC